MDRGMGRRRGLAASSAAWLLLASLGLAACGEEEEPVASATVPTAVPSPAEAEPATDDEDVTAEGLTAEEAQAVIDELDALHGEAAREAVGAGELTERFHELHRAVFAGEELEVVEAGWQQQVEEGFPRIVDEPGDPATVVMEVLTATKDCVLLATDRDFRPFLGDATSSLRYFVALETVGEDGAWRITMDGRTPDDEPPDEEHNPCA